MKGAPSSPTGPERRPSWTVIACIITACGRRWNSESPLQRHQGGGGPEAHRRGGGVPEGRAGHARQPGAGSRSSRYPTALHPHLPQRSRRRAGRGPLGGGGRGGGGGGGGGGG